MKINKNIKDQPMRNRIIALMLVACLLITGAFAFLTATDTKKNTFTLGKVKIELCEDGWYNSDPKKLASGVTIGSDGLPIAENVLPGQTIDKAPYIKNVGNNDAWVYLVVAVPTSTASQIYSNGSNKNVALIEGEKECINISAYAIQSGYISLDENDTNEENYNTVWDKYAGSHSVYNGNEVEDDGDRIRLFNYTADTENFVSLGSFSSDDGNDYIIYAYRNLLSASKETEHLFENVTLIDYIGNTQIDKSRFTMLKMLKAPTVAAPEVEESIQLPTASTPRDKLTMELTGSFNVYVLIDIDWYIGQLNLENPTIITTGDYSRGYYEDFVSVTYTEEQIREKIDISNGLASFHFGIIPNKLTIPIKIEICDGDEVKVTQEYSAYDYCQAVVNSETESNEFKALCKSMINYAACSQVQFGYVPGNTTALSVDTTFGGLTKEEIDALTGNTYKFIQTNTSDMKISTFSYMAIEDSALRYFVTGKLSDYDISLSHNINSNMAWRISNQNNKDYLEIYNIEAINLDKEFTVTLTNKTDATKQIIATASVFTYIRNTLRYSGSTENLKNLVKSLATYNKCSVAYFNSVA